MITTPYTQSQGSDINIVVTCAHRKHYTTPPELRIEGLPQRRVSSRFKSWIHRLAVSEAQAVPAEYLYAGEHWQIVRTLSALADDTGGRTRTWVCSAGYGLVPISASLRPYKATFTPGHADSVAATARVCQEWWDHHAAWEGPDPRWPRSLAALANRTPQAVFVTAMSTSYLRACFRDILRAAAQIRKPEQLSIITPGATAPSDLRDFVLPVDADLQQRLGGSLRSLNVRVAARLLQMSVDEPPTLDVLADKLLELRRGVGKRKPEVRKPLSNEDVRTFIAQHLTSSSTPSGLLRQLRLDGFACEQSRFATLFAATRGTW